MKLQSNNRLPQSMDVIHDTDKAVDSSCLLSLPTEVLITQLSYVGVNEVKHSVKCVCKSLYSICHLQPLWKEFCKQTGKLNGEDDHQSNGFGFNYKQLYECIPCVPIDYPNIMTALAKHRTINNRWSQSDPYTITLMPGLYHDQIHIDASAMEYDDLCGSKRYIHIRAAFPSKGAAIVYYDRGQIDQPIVSIRNKSFEEITDEHDHEGLMIGLSLSHIQFLHYTRGSDIWNGNCAIQVDGLNLSVDIVSCSIQSDSGRGLVGTRGAHINIYDSTVHDCAATGVYIGDLFTSALFERCNIIRNGGGTREGQGGLELLTSNTATSRRDMVSSIPSQNRTLIDTSDAPELEHHNDVIRNVVPPGHSGMYLETSTAIVRDCLLMNNSLTGLSVVRGGQMKLSNSDILANGSDPITIEDAHDVLLGLGEGIRGGVDDLGGNHCCGQHHSETSDSLCIREKEGRNLIRKTAYPTVAVEYTTIAKLKMHYA